MSRIGKLPIKIDKGVEVKADKGGDFNHLVVHVKGPKGELNRSIRKGIEVEIKDDEVLLTRKNDTKQNKAFHGLYRSLVANMIQGVQEEFVKELEIVGVGFRANMSGQNLELSLGLTHPVIVQIPEGLKVEVDDKVNIKISGIDKEQVGHFAAKVREIKKPEPYKGKGIRYKGEHVRRKAGKAAIATTE